MPLIANRKFLNLSGAYFLVVVAIGILSFEFDLPLDGDRLRSSSIYPVFMLPAAFAVLGVMISALIHIIKHKRFGWLILIALTAYAGAYVYGYSVASNPDFDD